MNKAIDSAPCRTLGNWLLGAVGLGTAIGCAAIFVPSFGFASDAYPVTFFPLTTFVVAVAAVIAATPVPGWLPARCIMRVDLVTALRHE